MEFHGARFFFQGEEILAVYAAADEDDEAGAGAADEQGEGAAAVPSRRGLTGGQEAGTAEGNDLVEGDERVLGANVEGAVEGDGKRVRRGDKPLHGDKIDGAGWRQRSDDDAGGTD